MAISYIWSISQLDCLPIVDGKQDYCITAHWNLSGFDNTYSGSVYSTASFPVKTDHPDYTPYDQLTEAQVLTWIWASGVDKDSAETAVAQQIENQINPPIVSPPLPWA